MTFLVAFIVTVAFVLLGYWDPLPIQVLRLKTFDLYQRLHPREPTRQPVIIVDLDEESLAAYGQWPWPRTLVADLVSRLMDLGAVVVGFDVVFAEPDRMSPAHVIEALRGLDENTRAQLERLPSTDVMFADILRRSRVVLGQSTNFRPVPTATDTLARKAQIAELGGDPRRWLFNFAGITRNLPELEQAASGLGMFTLKPEVDGVVRRVPMMMRVGTDIYPSLTVEMLRVATGQNTIVVESDPAGVKSIIVAGVKIPTDSAGRTWVNFTPYSRSRYISAKDVLDGTVPRDLIAKRLVLVGTSAVGLLDIKTTPIDDAMPGVDVHAQILETILANAYLGRPNFTRAVELSMVIAVSLILTGMIGGVGAVWGLFVGGSVLAAMAGLSWYLYVEQGFLLSVTYIGICSFVLYSILTYMNYVREETERRQVRDAFSRYMTPALVEQLAANPDRLKLGGEMRDMTLLFCDIRGFTGISETYKTDPQGLTRLINRFLTPMTDMILERRGTIDKYMGDCIMAFWNAPLDDEDHARHACSSALTMIAGIGALNDTLKAEAEAEGRPYLPIKIGIGLNSGECCVGNMGSEQRFDYSVLGDAVNLASRLEGQSKTYGVDIVMGENTQAWASDYAALELDLIRVKGKDEAVRIYALLGEPEMHETPEVAELIRLHGEMLAAYRSRRWTRARELVGNCRRLNGGLDRLYDLYEERLDAYEASPPGADWDGVFVATTK
ncbi:MAG: CHASE2 domain-containing protein [Alphaproteobacteria bacterium]